MTRPLRFSRALCPPILQGSFVLAHRHFPPFSTYNISYYDIFPEPGPLVLLFINPAGPTREITVSQEDTHDSAIPPVRPLASCCHLRLGSVRRRLQKEACRLENPRLHPSARRSKTYGHPQCRSYFDQ